MTNFEWIRKCANLFYCSISIFSFSWKFLSVCRSERNFLSFRTLYPANLNGVPSSGLFLVVFQCSISVILRLHCVSDSTWQWSGGQIISRIKFSAFTMPGIYNTWSLIPDPEIVSLYVFFCIFIYCILLYLLYCIVCLYFLLFFFWILSPQTHLDSHCQMKILLFLLLYSLEFMVQHPTG